MTSANITNSGTRYFYTDPLAAAWMAKHFGMKFSRCENAVTTRQYACDVIEPLSSVSFIADDSLHLLEPQVGDTCVHRMSDRVGKIHRIEHGVCHIYGDFHNALCPEILEIIQRGGIPFHWPEQEAA